MSDKMREALERLADACDVVGVKYFDTDTMDDEVQAMQTATRDARAALAEQPAQGEAVPDGMWKISKLIATLQSTYDRFGDTCVWMRECKWGAAALHAKSEAEAAPPAPAVPDAIEESQVPAEWQSDHHTDNRGAGYEAGWNACRAAMLAAAPEMPS